MFVKAIMRGHGYRCVYVYVTIKQISRTQLLVCVCNGSAPGSAIKKRLEMCECVCAHVRSRASIGMRMYVCVSHHHSPVDSFLCVYVCIYMLTPLNDCDYIRQYFTANYEVLCNRVGWFKANKNQ